MRSSDFHVVFSCSDLQRPILRQKFAVTESTMWRRRKRAKAKSKSSVVSVDAVLGFVVLHNWLGKQLLHTHQRASSTRVKNVWVKKCEDPLLYPELTPPMVGKLMQSYGRFMSQQLMPFYTISVSVCIDLFPAAGVEIKMDSWMGVTLKPRQGGLWFMKLMSGYWGHMSLQSNMITIY